MRLTLNGDQFELDAETVVSRLRGRALEPVQVHWVELGGVRFPVKQAMEAVLGSGSLLSGEVEVEPILNTPCNTSC